MELHFERNLIINNRELRHEGIFHLEEVYQTINKALEARGYSKREKKTEEKVTPAGKKSVLELRPFKQKSSYVTLMLKIQILADNLTETRIPTEHGPQLYHQGNLSIIFDAWLLSDYAHRWGMKPWVYFLKGIINKYVYTWPLEAGFTSELHDDMGYIVYQVRQLLRHWQKPMEGVPPEQEVMKQVEEEIRKGEWEKE